MSSPCGAMGSVWQALVWGFAGLRVHAGVLWIDPHLPQAWDSLEIRLRFGGARLRLELGHETAVLHTDRPISIRLRSGQPTTFAAGVHRIDLSETGSAP
jgi:trehalose/maltose hydrolase-like predicted phosphorylase